MKIREKERKKMEEKAEWLREEKSKKEKQHLRNKKLK